MPGKAASGLLCLPSRDLDEGFNNWFKGRASEKISVCVGLVLSGGRLLILSFSGPFNLVCAQSLFVTPWTVAC